MGICFEAVNPLSGSWLKISCDILSLYRWKGEVLTSALASPPSKGEATGLGHGHRSRECCSDYRDRP